MTVDDNYIMPFGVHKGRAMANVPGSYLLWFLEKGFDNEKSRAIKAYIKENLDVIKKEMK